MSEVNKKKGKKVAKKASNSSLMPEVEEKESHESGDETSDPAFRMQCLLQGIFSPVTRGQVTVSKLILKTENERDNLGECSTSRNEEDVALRQGKNGKDMNNAGKNDDPDTYKEVSSEARKNEWKTIPQRNPIDVIIEMQDEENRGMGLYAIADRTKEKEIKEMNLCGKLGKTDAKKTRDKEKVQFPTKIVRDTDSEMVKEKDINVSSRETKIRKKKGAAQLAKNWDRNKETMSGGKSGSGDISVLCKIPEAHLAREEDKSAETQQSVEKNQVKDTDAEMVKEKDINVSSRDTKIRKKKGAAQLAKKWDRNKETKSGGKSGSDDISVLCKTPEAHFAREEDKSAETQQSEEKNQIKGTDAEMVKEKDINVSSRDTKIRKKRGAAQLAKKGDRNKETKSGGKSGSDDVFVLRKNPEDHLAREEDKSAETQQSEKRSRNIEPQSPKESEGYWDSLEEEVMKMYQLDKFGNPIEKKAVDKDRILETQFPSEIVRDTDAEIAKGKDINVSSRDKKKRKRKGAAQLAMKWDANKETGSGDKCGSDISVLDQSPEAHLACGEDKNAETQQSEEGDQPTKQKQSQLLDNDTPLSARGCTGY